VKNRFTLDLEFQGSKNKIKQGEGIFKELEFTIFFIYTLHFVRIRPAEYSSAIQDL
jgi:hypothetical protein